MHPDAQSAKKNTSPLDLLVTNERAIASLYEEYARQHPARAFFWLELASAEYRHATQIESLRTPEKTDSTRVTRFSTEALRTFIVYVQEQEAVAKRGAVTFPVALSLSYYIETALIERRFFEQLPQQSSNVRRVMSTLRRETEEHVRKVNGELSLTSPK